jgi:heme exporter protein D
MREREGLAAAGYVEAVCWTMARIAEALHFAHERGVLHRDIKPANILIDPYGRPLLADFSLSIAGPSKDRVADEVFGGTLPYMAPEHLEAFNPECAVASDAVDERSDVYSLGVVLYELLALAPPFAAHSAGQRDNQTLTLMAQARRSPPPALHASFPDVPYPLDDALRRCLAGDPAERSPDASHLAESLEGCRLLCQADRRLPALGRFTKAIARAPLTALIVLSFLPHVAASLLAAAYNGFVLFPRLTPEQQAAFVSTAAIDCAIVFPLIAMVVVVFYGKTIRVWRRLAAIPPPAAAEVDRARQRLAATPMAATVFSLLGWLPPMLAIPLSLRAIGASMSWQELAHLAFSLLLGFLLAATYSFFIAQYAIVRIFYPQAWVNAARFASAAREELAAAPGRLRWFQIGAGVVPLTGAILIVGAGPQMFASGGYVAFRWLAVCLILLGMAGMWLSLEIGSLILKSIDALTQSARSADVRAP